MSKKKTSKISKTSRKKTGYWKTQKKSFFASFNIFKNKKCYKAMFFDFLAILSIVLVLNLTAVVFAVISKDVLPDLMEANQLMQSGDEEALNNALLELEPALGRVLWLFFGVSVISFLLIALAVSGLYGYAWRIILGKKHNKSSLGKYYAYNLLWLFLLAVLFFLVVKIFNPVIVTILFIIGFILCTYLDPVLRKTFNEKASFKENLSNSWKVGSKIFLFLPFLIITYIIIICLILISNLFLNQVVLFGIYWLVCLLFLISWIRAYIIQITDNFDNF